MNVVPGEHGHLCLKHISTWSRKEKFKENAGSRRHKEPARQHFSLRAVRVRMWGG